MKTIKIIFKNRWFVLAATAILVQQLMVGAGTFLIGDIAADVVQLQLSYYKITLLIFCLLLSGSFVNYMASYFTAKLQKSILFYYLQEYFKVNYNLPMMWRNFDFKSERNDLMTREAQDSISQMTHFMMDLLATALNIIFNTISVILVINWNLGLGLCLAGGLGLILVHLSDSTIRKNAHNEMETQNKLNGFLNKSWDNVVLGNKFFYHRWMNKFILLFKNAENSFIERNSANSFVNALASFITTGVVVGIVIYQIITHQSNVAFVSSLLVMFPRCLQIVMHMQIVQSYWTQWKHLSKKIELTEATLNPVNKSKTSVKKYIQYNSIELIRDHKKLKYIEFIDQIHSCQNGRYTILGNNGVGKSSLLMDLKAHFDEQALYIPTQNQLEIEDDFSQQSLSSGEIFFKTLNLIKSETKEKGSVRFSVSG